jgi:hypothetical protein
MGLVGNHREFRPFPSWNSFEIKEQHTKVTLFVVRNRQRNTETIEHQENNYMVHTIYRQPKNAERYNYFVQVFDSKKRSIS